MGVIIEPDASLAAIVHVLLIIASFSFDIELTITWSDPASAFIGLRRRKRYVGVFVIWCCTDKARNSRSS